jgi:hypothetical protein
LSTFFTTPESSLLELAVVPVWVDVLWLVDDWLDGLVVADDWPDGLVVADDWLDGLVVDWLDGLVADWLDELCAAAIVTPTSPAATAPIRSVFIC